MASAAYAPNQAAGGRARRLRAPINAARPFRRAEAPNGARGLCREPRPRSGRPAPEGKNQVTRSSSASLMPPGTMVIGTSSLVA